MIRENDDKEKYHKPQCFRESHPQGDLRGWKWLTLLYGKCPLECKVEPLSKLCRVVPVMANERNVLLKRRLFVFREWTGRLSRVEPRVSRL
jgi:hypothetical protein